LVTGITTYLFYRLHLCDYQLFLLIKTYTEFLLGSGSTGVS
jgi:hypothetical protein